MADQKKNGDTVIGFGHVIAHIKEGVDLDHIVADLDSMVQFLVEKSVEVERLEVIELYS